MKQRKRNNSATCRNHDAFYNALLTLMREKDFVAISVIEICNAAGVPRASFYNYFEDKYGILKYCFKRIADEISEYAGEPGAEGYFEKLVDAVLDYLEKNREVVVKLWSAEEGIGLSAIQNMLCARFKNNFEARDYKLRIPIDLISGVYAGSVISMIKWWLENENVYDKSQIVDYLAALVDPGRFV